MLPNLSFVSSLSGSGLVPTDAVVDDLHLDIQVNGFTEDNINALQFYADNSVLKENALKQIPYIVTQMAHDVCVLSWQAKRNEGLREEHGDILPQIRPPDVGYTSNVSESVISFHPFGTLKIWVAPDVGIDFVRACTRFEPNFYFTGLSYAKNMVLLELTDAVYQVDGSKFGLVDYEGPTTPDTIIVVESKQTETGEGYTKGTKSIHNEDVLRDQLLHAKRGIAGSSFDGFITAVNNDITFEGELKTRIDLITREIRNALTVPAVPAGGGPENQPPPGAKRLRLSG